ncbi:MAG: MotA/TolQ/ExbB proton channel family protein [Kiritimatiellia bacterium]
MMGTMQMWHYWASGGALLVPLAAVSFAILFLVTRAQLTARRLVREGTYLQRWLAQQTSVRDVTSLQRVLPASSFASVFQCALTQIAEGAHSPLEAMSASEDLALQHLRRDFLLITALTAAAPLLGLLGTVGGMITTFEAVAMVSGQTGTRVAGGISQALITTQFGLVIAMPGVFGLAQIRQTTRDVQFLLGDCRAHLVAMLGVRPQAVKGRRGG